MTHHTQGHGSKARRPCSDGFRENDAITGSMLGMLTDVWLPRKKKGSSSQLATLHRPPPLSTALHHSPPLSTALPWGGVDGGVDGGVTSSHA